MGSYHRETYDNCKDKNIIEKVQKYPYMGASGTSIIDIPTPENIRHLDLYIDTDWDYVEIRVYFEGNPANYLESDGTVSSPMSQFLRENITDQYDFVQHAKGYMDECTGTGHVFINADYLDATVAEYVDEVAYPLAERVAELFC